MLENVFEVNYFIMLFFIRGKKIKHQIINILTKPRLYDICIKLSKLVNTPRKVAFLKTEVVTLLIYLQVLTSENEKLLFCSISKVNLMLEC